MDLQDGQTTEVQGSGAKPYVLKNVGGVYSCSCPAWRNQSVPIERRTCKHLKKLRGAALEEARVGAPASTPPPASDAAGEAEEAPAKQVPPLLLAHTYEDQDITGFWMSEKLDGVRAYWDGKQFLSRLGNIYHAPDWFTAGLPSFPLDGELWMGRKMFQQCVSVVRRQDKSEHWRKIKFLVFDVPDMHLTTAQPFETRLQKVYESVSGLPYAEPHPHILCKGTDHLKDELGRVEALGGEGLMLRQPGSLYVAGRSTTLLKVKSFQDTEAKVIGYEPGKGKFKGMVGALQCALQSGIKFSVGTGLSDKERMAPPILGSIITVRYQELSTDNVPRFPSYVGVRTDVSW